MVPQFLNYSTQGAGAGGSPSLPKGENFENVFEGYGSEPQTTETIQFNLKTEKASQTPDCPLLERGLGSQEDGTQSKVLQQGIKACFCR